MNEPILHHDPASLFSETARLVLGTLHVHCLRRSFRITQQEAAR